MDFNLQQNVRDLLACGSPTQPAVDTIVSDCKVADSFLVRPGNERVPEGICSLKALQSPPSVNIREGRLPVQKDLGRKRTCCASEAALAMRKAGPGMWEGIL